MPDREDRPPYIELGRKGIVTVAPFGELTAGLIAESLRYMETISADAYPLRLWDLRQLSGGVDIEVATKLMETSLERRDASHRNRKVALVGDDGGTMRIARLGARVFDEVPHMCFGSREAAEAWLLDEEEAFFESHGYSLDLEIGGETVVIRVSGHIGLAEVHDIVARMNSPIYDPRFRRVWDLRKLHIDADGKGLELLSGDVSMFADRDRVVAMVAGSAEMFGSLRILATLSHQFWILVTYDYDEAWTFVTENDVGTRPPGQRA